jgi:hypothetical protein
MHAVERGRAGVRVVRSVLLVEVEIQRMMSIEG